MRRSPLKRGNRPMTTAAERRHLGRVAELGCVVCQKPATVHHVTSDGFQRLSRTHQRITPLCPTHHMIQFGPRESVEALGHAGFHATYGIDLLLLADWLWIQSQRVERGEISTINLHGWKEAA
jgi:hypothetical protein